MAADGGVASRVGWAARAGKRTRAAPTRSSARGAAGGFFLVAAYTVVAKVPGGELADDWLHTVLHAGSGAAAVYAGWIARGSAPATIFTAALALVYGALGVAGWFLDGFFLSRSFRVPLGVGDNLFHLALAIAALVALTAWRRRT